MKGKRFQIKRRIVSLLLAVVIVLIVVAPALAAVDPGGGSIPTLPDPDKYPAGMLRAEGWQ